jgi:hypothetical protein
MADPTGHPGYHQPSLFGQAQGPRDVRHPYGGAVRLVVPFDPWRLVVSLTGRDLSTSGVAAIWKGQPARPAVPAGARAPLGAAAARIAQAQAGKASEEVAALFVEGDPYDLQLEHDAEHLPAPFLRARLVRARRLPGAYGLELAFAFEAPDTDLLSLVHELESRGDGA